ncbi:hypothetical protein ACP4OV_010944 [Aristida adscensionis]
MDAPCSSSLIFLFLLLPAVLAMASPSKTIYCSSYPCECPQEKETRLHMYLHQFPAWPNVAKPNEILTQNLTNPATTGIFGTTYVHDWFLTMGPDPNEKIIGRAQGHHIQAGLAAISWYTSHIFVFQSGRFAGSTLQVLGIIDGSATGEWSIMGGTGAFANAHGTIKYKQSSGIVPSIVETLRELDIQVFTPESFAAVHGAAAI